MRNFKKYRVWQQSMELVMSIYDATKSLPNEELYGLVSQIRRSAVSIPSNIAEGNARGSDKEFGRFIEISMGSSFELETQLILAIELFDVEESNPLMNSLRELQMGLNALLKSLKIRRVG